MNNEGAFVKAFRQEMSAWGRDILTDEIVWIKGKYGDKARKEARAYVDGLSDSEVSEILMATAQKPCPECGR